MIMRWLSISAIFNCEASARRRPVAYKSSKIVRYRMLGAAAISFSTSSGLSTTGSFFGTLVSCMSYSSGSYRLRTFLKKKGERSCGFRQSRLPLLISQHVQLELANFFDTQLVRRFVEIRGEVTNGADVVANGA